MPTDLSGKIIGVLLAVVMALLANESRRLVNEVRKITKRQRESEFEQRRFIRTMFALLARLYPDKAEVITEEMTNFYWKPDPEESSATRWSRGIQVE
jgi:hypothetical protein